MRKKGKENSDIAEGQNFTYKYQQMKKGNLTGTNHFYVERDFKDFDMGDGEGPKVRNCINFLKDGR